MPGGTGAAQLAAYKVKISQARPETEPGFRGPAADADWNGDGLDDVAVYRGGMWQFRTTRCEQVLP